MQLPELHDIQRDYTRLRRIASERLPQPQYAEIKTWQDGDYLVEIRHTIDQKRQEAIGYKHSIGHVLHVQQVHDGWGFENVDAELVEKREHAPKPAPEEDTWSYAYHSDS